MPTIKDARKKQANRSARSKAQDRRKTAKTTFPSMSKTGIKRWLKDPSHYDVSGIDTKNARATVSLKPSKAR